MTLGAVLLAASCGSEGGAVDDGAQDEGICVASGLPDDGPAALAQAQSQLADDPSNAQAYYDQGLALLVVDNQVEQSVESLRTAVTLDDACVPFRVALGGVFAEIGEFDEAETVLVQAVELDAESLPAHRNLAVVYLRGEQPERALDVLSAARELADSSFEIEVLYATALLQSGDAAGAEKLFRELIEGNPDDASLLVGLGDALAAQGRDDEAAEAYAAAGVDPNAIDGASDEASAEPPVVGPTVTASPGTTPSTTTPDTTVPAGANTTAPPTTAVTSEPEETVPPTTVGGDAGSGSFVLLDADDVAAVFDADASTSAKAPPVLDAFCGADFAEAENTDVAELGRVRHEIRQFSSAEEATKAAALYFDAALGCRWIASDGSVLELQGVVRGSGPSAATTHFVVTGLSVEAGDLQFTVSVTVAADEVSAILVGDGVLGDVPALDLLAARAAV